MTKLAANSRASVGFVFANNISKDGWHFVEGTQCTHTYQQYNLYNTFNSIFVGRYR
jgi:hypothetical protein